MSDVTELPPQAETQEDQYTGRLRITFPHLIRELQPLPEHLAAVAADGPADTFGWDTVFAIRASDMNAALQKPGATPPSFNQQESSTWFGSGTFGAWQVALGGGGEDLNMVVPVATGSMTYEGTAYDFGNSTLTIQIKLQQIPQPGATTTSGPNDFKVSQQEDAVSVLDIVFGGTAPPSNIKWLILGMMSDWFNQNLQQFNHVFSTVDLNMTADQAQFQWMKPNGPIGYSYVDGTTLDAATFGVQCMLTAGATAGQPSLSASAIPSGQRAGFMVNPGPYFQNVLLAGLPGMFQNAQTSNFTYYPSDLEMRNNTPLSQAAVTVGAGTYTPQIDTNNFSVTIEGSELVIDIKKAHINFSPGIDIYLDYTGYMTLAVEVNDQGQQVLTLTQSRDPVTNHYVDVASWVQWTSIVAGLVAGVITAFVGAGAKAVFQSVVWRVVATIITLLIIGIISQIGTIMIAVASGDKDKLPPVNLLLIDATNPVTWPLGTPFTLGVAQFNGLFQLGGTYQIPQAQ